jgi:hypothetical protein
MMETVTIEKPSLTSSVVQKEDEDAQVSTTTQTPAAAAVDEIEAVVHHMQELSETFYKRPTDLPEPFNGEWRRQIIEWMYAIVKYCNLSHESVAAASFYLDSCVTNGLINSPDEYQLGAMCALYLALKVYDSPAQRTIKLESLIKLGTGRFNEKDVAFFEMKMVKALHWRVHPPTINCFLQQYMALMKRIVSKKTIKSIDRESFLIIEIIVSRESFQKADPSVLAFATILAAIERAHDIDMTIAQLNSFLNLISLVAKLDASCPMLDQVSQDLAEAMFKSICCPGETPSPASSSDEKADQSADGKKKPPRSSPARRSPSRSPNHVIWRYF